MRKATFALATLALLALSGTASAAPVRVNLETHNQRSSSGTLSTLKWKTCAPLAQLNPCISTTNVWTQGNATGSTAVWTWDAATGILSMTGTFQTTSHLSSNANGSSVISDKVVDMVINTSNSTTTAASYNCVEGTFLASVGANGCLNTTLGDDFANNSSVAYNVGGNALCVQRALSGDDVSTGNPRGLTSVPATGSCDPQDGAFDLWTVVTDTTTSPGGQLVVSNGIGQLLAGTNYFTFSAGANAADDGPFNVLQGIGQTLNVLANDFNFVGDVTVTVSTPPAKGTATVQGVSPGPQGGIQIQYTAGGASTGTDTFVYTITDGTNTDTATVTVDILPGGANDDTATTTRNSAAININVGTNDVGFTDPVTIAITSAPNQGGTATPPASGPLANAIVSYTPATTAQFTATYTETFTYQVTDANSAVSTATVTVTVNNSIPVAGDGGVTISTQGSAPGSINGTFNAGTLAGNNLGNSPSTVSVTTAPTKGTTSVAGSVVTYTPLASFYSGTDTFDYTITDGDPGTPETDSGTVTVTIADVSPTLADGTITTASGTASAPKALSFTAGNGSVAQHTLAVTTQALNGSCAVSGTSLIYTPNAAYTGGDSCVVTITDENGAGQSDAGTFTITVTGGSSGGGGSGGLLPGGSGAADPLSLALLAGLPLLGRLRARRRAAGNQ